MPALQIVVLTPFYTEASSLNEPDLGVVDQIGATHP